MAETQDATGDEATQEGPMAATPEASMETTQRDPGDPG